MFSKNILNAGAKYELSEIAEMENKLNRNELIYEKGNKKKGKRVKHMIFKSVKQYDHFEVKFIAMIYH